MIYQKVRDIDVLGNIPSAPNPGASSLDFDGSGNLIYFGIAIPGTPQDTAEWQIRKLTYDGSGNLLTITWADGVRSFNHAWDDRVSLTYE
jgi:YD repeat-containing protein